MEAGGTIADTCLGPPREKMPSSPLEDNRTHWPLALFSVAHLNRSPTVKGSEDIILYRLIKEEGAPMSLIFNHLSDVKVSRMKLLEHLGGQAVEVR